MKYRIFIVEDDETIANLLKKHLSSWGYDVFLAEDFSNILQEFAGKDPQLVLLDLKLPFYNGFHWCEEIRKVSQVPVIFISSAADNMNMVMAMSRGADDFIAKPFDMDVLVAKIQAILRRTYSFGNPGNVLEHKGAVLNLSRATLTWNGEETEENRESGAQLFRIEQYVEMVLGYLRTEDMSADLKLTRCSLDRIIREQIHKYAGIFVSKKLSLSYEGTDAIVLTDEKWLGFVIGQILSNALKYTRTGGIEIWLEDERGNRVSENPNLKQNTAPGICNTAPATLVIADSGIGIQPEDLPRIFEKGYTGVNGREDNRATGIGLYLSRKILRKLGHEITVDSQVDKGTEVRMSLWKKDLEMY